MRSGATASSNWCKRNCWRRTRTRGLFASVGRPIDGAAPEDQLLVDIRSFCVSASDPPNADVAIGAKLISADGKVVAAREFHRSASAASLAAPDAVSALSAAFVGVETDLVAWASEVH